MAKVKWESIEIETTRYSEAFRMERALVPNGWLVMAHTSDGKVMTFVPDPQREWN